MVKVRVLQLCHSIAHSFSKRWVAEPAFADDFAVVSRPMARMLGLGIGAGILVACGATPPASAPLPLVGRVPLDLPAGAVARGASLFGTDVVGLPTGATITPDAAPGASVYELDPHFVNAPALRAGNAVATALSPDGKTLAVLTSGFNRTFDAAGRRVEPGSSEYLSSNRAKVNFHQLNRIKAISCQISASGVAHCPWERIHEAAQQNSDHHRGR